MDCCGENSLGKSAVNLEENSKKYESLVIKIEFPTRPGLNILSWTQAHACVQSRASKIFQPHFNVLWSMKGATQSCGSAWGKGEKFGCHLEMLHILSFI